MTLKSNSVSTRFEPLFGKKLVGVRHAELVTATRPYSESEADWPL